MSASQHTRCGQYQSAEWTFTSASPTADPFNDVEVDAVFEESAAHRE